MKKYLLLLMATICCWTIQPIRAALQKENFHTHDSIVPSSLTITSPTLQNKICNKFSTCKDTVIFISSMFTTEKGAHLNELLKQIPGLKNKDGTLFWYDKETEILINHKEFFGGYGILTLIPCEIVERILIYNNPSALTQQSQRDDQEEDFMVDVCVDPIALSKWMGRVMAGIQNGSRYETEIEGIHLSDDTPFAGFANFNNLNRSTVPHHFLEDDKEIGQFGKQQFGSFSLQHNWKTTNHNDEFLDQYTYFNLSACNEYGWGDREKYVELYSLDAPCNFSLSNIHPNTQKITPTISQELGWTLNSRNTLTLNTDFRFEKKDSLSENQEFWFNENPYSDYREPKTTKVSKNYIEENPQWTKQSYNAYDNKSHLCHLDLKAKWKSVLKHRNKLEITASFSHQKGEEQYESTYEIKTPGQPEDSQQQFNLKPMHETCFSVNTFYKHWITRHLLFSGSYNFSTLNFHEKQNHYLALSTHLSSEDLLNHPDSTDTYLHRYNKKEHLISARFVFNYKKLSVIPHLHLHLALEEAHHHRARIDTVVRRNRPRWNPSLMLKWQFHNAVNAYIKYEYQENRPALLDVIPWIDNTDPVYRKEGNQRLHSSKIHNAHLYFLATLPSPQITINSQILLCHQSQPITSVYLYNSNTKSYTIHQENAIHPAYSLEWNMDFQQFFCTFWNIKSWIHLFIENRDGFLMAYTGQKQMKSNRQHFKEFQISPEISYDDHCGFKITLYGNLVFTGNQYRSYAKPYHRIRLYDYGVNLEKYIGQLQLRTDLHDRINRGYNNPHVNGHRLLWSASAAWFCMKGRGRLKLALDDILNNTNFYSREIEPNQHTEVYKKKLKHFVNLTFTYHLNP